MKDRYLVRKDPTSGKVEILLILDAGPPIKAICVNKSVQSDTGFDNKFINTISKFNEFRSKSAYYLDAASNQFPILFGGQSTEDEFVLHTPFKNQDIKSGSPFYRMSSLEDFFKNQIDFNSPALCHFVKGMEIIPYEQLPFMFKGYECYFATGLHAMTYGINLEAKAANLPMLNRQNDSKPQDAAMSILGDIMGMFQEAAPSLMHASVFLHLRDTRPEISNAEILEITRMSIAVSETEGSQVMDVFKKFSLQEIEEKYRSLFDDPPIFKLLENFDLRFDAMRKIGLNPVAYDLSVVDTMSKLGPKPKPKNDSQNSGSRKPNLVQKINKFSDIVKGPSDETP